MEVRVVALQQWVSGHQTQNINNRRYQIHHASVTSHTNDTSCVHKAMIITSCNRIKCLSRQVTMELGFKKLKMVKVSYFLHPKELFLLCICNKPNKTRDKIRRQVASLLLCLHHHTVIRVIFITKYKWNCLCTDCKIWHCYCLCALWRFLSMVPLI